MATACFYSSNLMLGFDLLYKRTEEVLKSTTDIAKFFKSLSDVESEYAKNLVKLTQSTKKTLFQKSNVKVGEKEKGTLREGWDQLQAELENISNRHTQYSVSLANEISQSCLNYVKEKELERKRLLTEGQKITKEYQAVIAEMKKSQQNYYSKCKEAEACQLAHEKAKAEGVMKPKDLNKLSAKASKAMEVASAVDSEYKRLIKKANSKQSKFFELEMPLVLKQFQEFEESRIKFLKDTFSKFHSVTSELPPFWKTACDSLENSISKINPLTDVQIYAEENRTNAAIPGEIQYEQYNAENPNFAISSTSAPVATPRTVNVPQSGGAPVDNRRNESFKTYGLSADENSLPRDEKIRRLREQLNEVCSTIKSELKSRRGLEKLVKFYASDPLAQEKARGELEDQNKKIQAMREARTKIVTQLSGLGENVTLEPDGDEDEQSGASVYGATTVTSAVAQDSGYYEATVRARGLYDYNASNESELTFRSGDILTVTEQDESGWWYAEINGVAGFVPRNYLELI
eukprot:TRINITY_DN1657_c1_g3_i1.p1 TRINITY_DN1657_c1_g3~~TRINITY_DN1657_c1_g3_i1.p1  ORF type:complete len:518 (+),score=247.51 TRINITY_DN1657_c1_g3_i1:181-1734(+)